jgi:hypothetical protein
MSQPTPWKLAVTGGIGVLAAIALLSGVALAVALIARPTGSVRATAVTIGLLLLAEGAREIAEPGLSMRRERRSHTTAPTQPAATAS